jgi:hypothetical protein
MPDQHPAERSADNAPQEQAHRGAHDRRILDDELRIGRDRDPRPKSQGHGTDCIGILGSSDTQMLCHQGYKEYATWPEDQSTAIRKIIAASAIEVRSVGDRAGYVPAEDVIYLLTITLRT